MNEFKIELIKIRRSHIFWILLIPAAMMWIPSALNADVNFRMNDIGISPEHNFFIQGFMGMAWFMIPAALIICTVLLNQTERTNKGFLKMLSLPVSTGRLCLAKFLVMLLLMTVQMLFTIVFYYAGALLASRLEDYDFVLELPYVIHGAAMIYLAIIPMASIFWMLAVLIQTPIFSAGICLASIVPSVLMLNTKLWAYYPMDYPFYMLMTEYGKLAEGVFTTEIKWIPMIPVSLAVTVLCLGISCLRFGKTETR
ncbi:MAG: ABC transporter permease subunit [Dorea sp.]|nr:ABC transporter permease subunit [Dorea sp.]